MSNLLREVTGRFDRTLKSMIYAAAAGAAAIASLFFLTLAAFLLLQVQYGTMYAALIMGAAYAVLAFAAFAVVLILGRKKPPPAGAPKTPAWWQDPIVITSALQVARSLGPRTIITLAAVGALAAGFLLTSSKPANDKPPDKD